MNVLGREVRVVADSRRFRPSHRVRLERVERLLNVRLPRAMEEDEATLRFLEGVARAPTHTRQEEREQIRRVQECGDAAALEALVRANLRHVVAVAVRYCGHGLSLMDLVQEGAIGLLAAIARFDCRRRVRLAHYARWWIVQAIARAVNDKGDLIRLPVHMHERLRRYCTCVTRLVQELGRFPCPAEVAAVLKTSEAQVNQLRALLARERLDVDGPVDGLSEGRDGPDEPLTLAEVLRSEEDGPEERVMRDDLRAQVEQLLAGLHPRARTILVLRFGLVCHEPYTLEEVGKRLGLTRERVRQIETAALDRLRQAKLSKTLQEYLRKP
ncbi:MAG: sigma-70 family RNA polymerase sigma factor [Calditerricola sp.]|nr:sigma-70 family RNA polymerase sigma factor [Calditerricola sp.]